MKTYFRLLTFARPIEKYAFPYAFFSITGVIFNTLNLALLVPLLQVLFYPANPKTIIRILPSFRFSFGYFHDLFVYNSYLFTQSYGKLGALEFVCLVIICSVFISNLCRYLSQRIMENLKIHTLQNLRQTVFNNVMNLHLGYFSNERKGDVLSKITSDVQVVQFTITSTLQVVFKDPLQLAAYLGYLFYVSSRLTLLSLLVVPVSGLIIAAIVKRLRHQASDAQKSYGIMMSLIEEALSGIKIIKSFNALEFVKNRFAAENSRFAQINRSMARRQQLASPISEFLGVGTVVMIVLYGGYLILEHKTSMTADLFIAYIAIYSQVINPIKSISGSFSNIHQGLAAGDRVLGLIDFKPEVVDTKNSYYISEFNTEIEFRNVSFGYGDKNVLDNVSFFVAKGTTVALVGPSGAGKSTISDLLCRFYDVNSGSILVDGHDLRAVQVESLRALMGMVNQESILFNDTIYNNIVFGRADITEEAVIAAAKIANAHEFIMATDNGYQSSIGDRGVKLSGGQKQRLSIARAVLINPPILILDEATSALDTESEKLVQGALNNLLKNRTSLVIAHRLSTIQQADKIIVLDSGRIIETGTHSELMLLNGLYHKLISMQMFQEM